MPSTHKIADKRAAEIRPLEAKDISTIRAVIDATGMFPGDMIDDMAAPFLDGNGGDDHWLVAEVGGPVAVAYFTTERMTEGTWNLLLIAVHPTMQSKGIGAAMMRKIEADLAARGARVLLVETSGLPEFARTRAFYLRDGYEEEARIRDFYQDGEDKIVFRRGLKT